MAPLGRSVTGLLTGQSPLLNRKLLLLDRVVPSPVAPVAPYLLLLPSDLHSLNSLWCALLVHLLLLESLVFPALLVRHQTCWIHRPCIPCTPWGPSGLAPISLVSLEFQLLLVLQLLPLSLAPCIPCIPCGCGPVAPCTP